MFGGIHPGAAGKGQTARRPVPQSRADLRANALRTTDPMGGAAKDLPCTGAADGVQAAGLPRSRRPMSESSGQWRMSCPT